MVRYRAWTVRIVLVGALGLVASAAACSGAPVPAQAGANGADSGNGSGKPVLTLKGGAQ
jgi:hypothetical protein